MKIEETIYPSKVDWWVWLILIGAPLIHLPLGILVMMRGFYLFGFGLIVWGLIIALVIASFSFPCRYVMSATSLTIRSGIVTDSFSLDRITAIKPVQSLAPAPALSRDRLELTLNDGTKRLISPSRQAEFIQQIESRRTA